MEDQIEEVEVLGSEAWNEEYDIAEEEEERLLEEQVLQEGQDLQEVHSDRHESLDYENSEVEEDVLDLGLNEDIIEYEEHNLESQDVASTLKTSVLCPPVSNHTALKNNGFSESSNAASKTGAVSKVNVKASDEQRNIQQVLPRKNVNHVRQSTFPPHLRNGSQNQNQFKPRMALINRPPIHPNQFNSQQHRPPNMWRSESLSRMHFDSSHHQRAPQMQPRSNELFNQHGNFPDVDRNANHSNSRCFINPHYKGSVSVQASLQPHMTFATELAPSFVQAASKGPIPPMLFRGRPLNPPLSPAISLNQRSRGVAGLPNTRFPPPINVPPPPGPRPPPPGPHLSATPRFPSAAPGSALPQLMDVIVPPVFRGDSGAALFTEPPPPARPVQRFRFNYALQEQVSLRLVTHSLLFDSNFQATHFHTLQSACCPIIKMYHSLKNNLTGVSQETKIEGISIFAIEFYFGKAHR